MITAKQILEMIEAVDPEDDEKLQKIDVLVYLYTGDKSVDNDNLWHVPYYTRSRDALKAIRPKGWFYQSINYHPLKKLFCAEYSKESNISDLGKNRFEVFYPIYSALLFTEELAELHCIVQALESDRQCVIQQV